jgi:hypothetical protein
MPTLTRLKSPAPIVGGRAEIIARAREVFHTDVPLGGTSLRKALYDLGIAPLDPDQVAKYQASKTYHQHRVYSGAENVFGVLAIVGALIAAYALCFGPMFLLRGEVWPPMRVVILSGGVTMMIGGIIARYVADEVPYESKTWQKKSLGDYGLTEIPDFVLERAVLVKEACPDAKLYVETLVSDRYSVTLRDPFLIAVQNGERYFLDVWDEPQFERTV